MNRRVFLGVAGAGLWTVLRPGPLLPSGPAVSVAGFDGDRLVERWSWAMGQAVHVVLFTNSEDAGLEAAAAALAELRRVEGALSLFDPASDVVALNQRAGRGPVPVGSDLLAVLESAQRYRRLTGGAFNPAIEPLMRAWGFHAPRASAPSAAELAKARGEVRQAKVVLEPRAVVLPNRHTQLDLGGIGVGYGLDQAAAVLRRAGARRAFIDISGDCIALGAPPGRQGWPVDIVDPAGGIYRSVRLRDAALATSANTASVVRYGDIVCGHVLDPATGGAANALLQASVIAPAAITADALSTAVLVSGRRPPGVTRVIRYGS